MPGQWGLEATKRFCVGHSSHFNQSAVPDSIAQWLRPFA